VDSADEAHALINSLDGTAAASEEI